MDNLVRYLRLHEKMSYKNILHLLLGILGSYVLLGTAFSLGSNISPNNQAGSNNAKGSKNPAPALEEFARLASNSFDYSAAV